MTDQSPVFFDCEASALNGFPIEIGWAFTATNGDIVSEACLIRPPDEWEISNYWDPAAQDLHEISVTDLYRHGQHVWEIARWMNAVLARRDLYSDSPFDEHWLVMVFEAADIAPAFTIHSMDAHRFIAMHTIGDAAMVVQDECPEDNKHRAEPDAQSLARLWRARTAR